MIQKDNSTKLTCPDCRQPLPADYLFCGFCGKELNSGRQIAKPRMKNERRDVAILFADVSGFTSMCESMDPEDVFTLMNEVFDGLGRAISKEGGHIDKYIGDNVMALFGAPVAHEDDPARACRAAIGMQNFLKQFATKLCERTGVLLKMRIGINCGLVLAGYIGSEVKKEYSVLGDTVNLASRLESKAPPGGILISEAMASRISGFSLGPVQELTVKGKSQPVKAFEILGELKTGQRWKTGIFTGRARELARISRHLARQKAPFEPLIIIGEAGLGKSRLMTETVRRNDHCHFIFANAAAERQNQPFALFRQMLLENLPELTGNDRLFISSQSLAGWLASLSPALSGFSQVFTHLLEVNGTDSPLPELDPAVFRQTIETGIELLLRSLARYFTPLIICIDSLEYADQASLDIICKMQKKNDGLPCHILAACRAAPAACFSGTALALQPLTEKASIDLLKSFFAARGGSETFLHELAVRAAGNPLFLEEYARWTVVSDSRGEAVRNTLPPTLRALVVSRLDQISAKSRDFLAGCSILGCEFEIQIARSTSSQMSDDELSAILQELQKADLIEPAQPQNFDHWIFRQKLVHDVCYETMLINERRKMHLATAEALIQAGSHKSVAPAVMAFHYEKAEAWPESAGAKIGAGNQAAAFGLNAEACRWFSAAIEDLRRCGEVKEHLKSLYFSGFQGMTQSLIKLGKTAEAVDATVNLEQFAETTADKIETARIHAEIARVQGNSESTAGFFRQAISLSENLPPARQNPRLYQEYAEYLLKRGLFEEARKASEIFRQASGSTPAAVIQSDTLSGKILYAAGSLAGARDLFLRAYHQALQAPGIAEKARTANLLGNVERDMGNYENARCYFQDALEAWQKTGDAECIAGANNNLGNLEMSLGNYAAAGKYHSDTLKRWLEIGNVAGAALSQANLAILALEKGDGAEAIKFAGEALKNLKNAGNEMLVALVRVIEGEGLLATGKVRQAEKIFSGVLGDYDQNRAKLAHAGAVRGLGRVRLHEGNTDEALRLLEDAGSRYRTLKRNQEAARTLMFKGEALLLAARRHEALLAMRQAMQEFEQMKAGRDRERSEARIRSIEVDADSEKETG